ncbi:MAG: ASPIC/UnbV domain-containing protein, partial [Saprospiraceae bacterium]
INALYVNDGSGNFTESAAAYGLANSGQSWTADFADYDNDGDFDCFITQHDVPSQLLRNDGMMFTDVTAASGIVLNVTPIQGIMEDFDNDGYVDLLIAGSDEQFFHNNGDGTFTELTGLFDNNAMESFGIGDLNHDGFLDIYGGYASIFTSPSGINDALWMNNGNSNNYMVVTLEGIISNKDAVGAKVELHGSWGVQIREVRAGEGYGIVNSFAQHFGIGTETEIDKIVVKWPSGIVDEVLNPSPNQYVHVIENNCASPNATISYAGDSPVICSGSTLDLTAASGYTYQWSTGETTQNIIISTAGTYGLTVTDGTGCPGQNFINVVADPDVAPTVSFSGNLEFCEGGSVTLTSTTANGYMWSTGETTQSISVSSAGNYEVIAGGECVDLTSNSIAVDVLAAPAPTAPGQTIGSPQSVVLTATGNDMTWYDMPIGGTLLALGANYTTPVLNATTTYYVEDSYPYTGFDYNASAPDHTGTSLYSGPQYNGEVIFDALESFTLKTVKVYTDTPGTRIIELR